MNSACLCSLAGRYDNPIPTRFLAPIDFLKIPALPLKNRGRGRGRSHGSSLISAHYTLFAILEEGVIIHICPASTEGGGAVGSINDNFYGVRLRQIKGQFQRLLVCLT
jgi:hypothetical protein